MSRMKATVIVVNDFLQGQTAVFEFHVSRVAREKYAFDSELFSSTGNVVFADFQAARVFAERMNAKRDLARHPEQAVLAGHINAMGLIDELLHKVIAVYRVQVNPRAFENSLQKLVSDFGERKVNTALLKFVQEFPPRAVYQREQSAEAYLQDATAGVPNRVVALEEMLILWLANMNPAYQPFHELFDDTHLRQRTVYQSLIAGLGDFFKKQPGFGQEKLDLVTLLRQPALAKPNSLQEQLRFISEAWKFFLGEDLQRLLSSLDFIKEEQKAVFAGPPPTQVAAFEGEEFEPEQFSQDLHWMPRLVLVAKSTLVWLEQLSREYGRPISRLNEIPDEALDKLASWGFTGLWLIGVWQRSAASKQIKQMCGNPEAESSAYSLFDYEIAAELGGAAALDDLKQRCMARGIRLACDMVPNHTGIDSRWVREHPDWFIATSTSPFPNYSFHGTNLSGDPRYGIFIEDKYYSRTDAAVVFKREDYWTGDVRYIYHGNDGTNMPWNDTAQLNYLLPEVREAVVQKILSVARMFPVIRFDAAMTLSKRHYQRLWFPEPGSGGDIPSRAEHGMTKAAFNRQMPVEFWREVVDRVAQEVPDTLLLAEAFWLMEGYFVRTLGMHRVYNSAFMNMLKNEENEKYRQTIINTIQFNPEILKRYVNFMNNPDEETAIVQFGDGDKYFGVCLMLVTMPGLPMIGHGQVEGLHEKYGMEYRRAYWDEQVNDALVRRHENEIFPLMKKRYLFAEVENFLFFDFVTAGGQVNHNVFAYCNRYADERAIVIYNNKFEDTAGWLHLSVPAARHDNSSGDSALVRKTLGQGLAIPADTNAFCVFTDAISGLQYIRSCRELCERGLYVELNAYDRHVFLDFQIIEDDADGHYARLYNALNGRGVANIHEEVKELAFQHLLRPLDGVLSQEMFACCFDAKHKLSAAKAELPEAFTAAFSDFLLQAQKHLGCTGNMTSVLESVVRKGSLLRTMLRTCKRLPLAKSKKTAALFRYLEGGLQDNDLNQAILFCWLVLHETGRLGEEAAHEQISSQVYEAWLMKKRVERFITEMTSSTDAAVGADLVGLLVGHQNWFVATTHEGDAHELLEALLAAPDVQAFLLTNWYDGILWFNKERFQALCWWLLTIAVVQNLAQPGVTKTSAAKRVTHVYSVIESWRDAEKRSGYQVNELLARLSSGKSTASAPAARKRRPGWVRK